MPPALAKCPSIVHRFCNVTMRRVSGRRTGLTALRRPVFAARLAFVLLLALLLQQAAIAAYACPIDSMPTAPVMSECASMAQPDPPLLCEKHCNPDRSTTPEARVASVPPAILAPIRFELVRSLTPDRAPCLHERVPVRQSDPPPTLRFCSLLI